MNSTEEEVFDVERIVDDRIYKGEHQYLIKWVGYPESENTWELESNLMCEEILAEYMENKKNASKLKVTKSNTKKDSLKGTSKKQTKDELKEKVVASAKEIPGSKEIDGIVKNPVFERLITNEWDNEIYSVTGAQINKNGQLEIEMALKDGTKAVALSEEVRYKAPLKLLDFYESSISFVE